MCSCVVGKCKGLVKLPDADKCRVGFSLTQGKYALSLEGKRAFPRVFRALGSYSTG